MRTGFDRLEVEAVDGRSVSGSRWLSGLGAALGVLITVMTFAGLIVTVSGW